MPFNGLGVYTFPSLPGSFNPAVTGQPATAANWTTLATDIQSAMSTAICKDGQTTITANLPMATYKHTGVGAAAAATDYARADQVVSSSLTYAADTGSADAYAIAPTVPIAAYAAGQVFRFIAANSNTTTAPTLAVSGLAAKTIFRPNGNAMVANDILANAVVAVMYTAAGNFMLLAGGANSIQYSMLTTRGDLIRRGASIPERVALGSSGQALTSNGTDAVWGWVGGVVRIQTFTSTGTYTPHARMVNCIIECVGGGGGGAGVADAAAGQFAGGGGGGAGSYSRKLATAADIGASKAVTIGAAGAAASSGANAGGNGGDTSVGSLCIGKGGTGGASVFAGGAGGVAGTGDVTPPGMAGFPGMLFSASGVTGQAAGGTGGSGPFGAGAKPGTASTAANGAAASGYGAGGSGGCSFNAGGAAAGGAGTAGYVVITEYCSA